MWDKEKRSPKRAREVTKASAKRRHWGRTSREADRKSTGLEVVEPEAHPAESRLGDKPERLPAGRRGRGHSGTISHVPGPVLGIRSSPLTCTTHQIGNISSTWQVRKLEAQKG